MSLDANNTDGTSDGSTCQESRSPVCTRKEEGVAVCQNAPSKRTPLAPKKDSDGERAKASMTPEEHELMRKINVVLKTQDEAECPSITTPTRSTNMPRAPSSVCKDDFLAWEPILR